MNFVRAKAFLESIEDDTPEDLSRIWFENALYEVRLAAFVQLETENRKLQEVLEQILTLVKQVLQDAR